jgi:hypothetical protein
MQKDKPGMLREFMELVGLVFLLIIKAFFNGFALFKAIGKRFLFPSLLKNMIALEVQKL